MTKVIKPTPVAVAISETMLTLIDNAVQQEAKTYGARIDFAVGINNIAPADCRWYALEGMGQKLPAEIKAIKDAYYAGLKKIGYSNVSSAWGKIKEYAEKDAVNRAMFGEIAPEHQDAKEESAQGETKNLRAPQSRLLQDLTILHDYCVREKGKNNPEFLDKHTQAHIHIIAALKALGKNVGI